MAIKKVGVIGPTDIAQHARLLDKLEDTLRERAAVIGQILAELGYELWVNSETRGIPFEVAKSYKGHNGTKLTVLVSGSGRPWPPAPLGGTEAIADDIRVARNWFMANYEEVSKTDLVIAAGLSAGTFSEFGYIAWNLKLEEDPPSTLKHLVVVREFLRGRILPLELEKPVASILEYVDRVEELRDVLRHLTEENQGVAQ